MVAVLLVVVVVGTIVNEDEVVSVDVRVELPLTPRADADVGCDDEPDDCCCCCWLDISIDENRFLAR